MRRATFPYLRKASVPVEQRSASVATPTALELDLPRDELAFRIFDLPLELQGEILCLLGDRDIFNLRLASKSLLRLLQANESLIVRHLWKARFSNGKLPCLCSSKPDFVSVSNIPVSPTFDDYFRYLRRDKVVARLAESLATFVESKILRLYMRSGLEPIAKLRRNLVGRLRLALGHLYDYWQEYRVLLEDGIMAHSYSDDTARQRKILNGFCVPCLLECYGIFDLLFLALCMKLRPKTYAGSIERVVRRWNVEAAPIGEIAMLLIYGGFEVIEYLLRMKPYAKRRAALSNFMEHLTTQDLTPLAGTKAGREAIGKLGKSTGSNGPKDWSHFQLLPSEYSTITAETRPPPDLAMRCSAFKYLSTFEARQLFESWEIILLQERKDIDRPLLGGFQYAFVAMQAAPKDLDYAKIQEDWTTHYAPRGRSPGTYG
jgi:F-box domain